MDTAYNEILIPTVAARCTKSAKIEGNTDCPEGKDVRRVLICRGDCTVTRTEVAENNVTAYGELELRLVCEDAAYGVFSFTTSASYQNDIECEGAKHGMTANVTAQIVELHVKPKDNTLAITAEVEFSCRLEERNAKLSVKANGDAPDIELQTQTIQCKRKITVGESTVNLREEIVANDAADILFISGSAYLRDVMMSGDNVRCEGVLCVTALCAGNMGRLFSITQNIPFSTEIEPDEAVFYDLFGKAYVTNISARALGEEFGLVAIEATIKIDLFACEDEQYELTLDAYSPSKEITCECMREQFLTYTGSMCQRSSFKNTIDAEREIKSVVYTNVRAQIASASQSDDEVYADGVAYVSILCTDSENKLFVQNTELPFSARLGINGKNVELDATVCTISAIAQSVGDKLELSYTLMICADVFSICDIEYVTKLAVCGECKKRTGILVCFAGEGETVFDLGKRFSVSTAELTRLNPKLNGKLSEGDKAVVLL